MAFSFEQPPEQARFSLNPKLLLGIGGGVVALIVVGIIIAVALRSPNEEPIVQQEEVSETVEQGSGVTTNVPTTPAPAEEVGIQYKSSPAPTLVIGDTHILSAEEKKEYGFPANVTVRSTVVAGADGKPTLKMEYVTSR
jgi:hypothetical protein